MAGRGGAFPKARVPHTAELHQNAIKAASAPGSKTQQDYDQSSLRRFPWHSILFLTLGMLLGKFHPQIGDQIKIFIHFMRPHCQLGNICAWYEKRPLLDDGRLSSPVWDVPRKHLVSEYSALHRLRQGASVRKQWEYPRVVWISAVLEESDVNLLRKEAGRAFANWGSVENSIEMATVHEFELPMPTSQVLQGIVRLIGIPSKNYVEKLVFWRYTKDSRVKSHVNWCQNSQASKRFAGCDCAAVVQLTLASAKLGGTDVISANSANEENALEMLVTSEVGDMLAWFIMHPMTESAQHIRHETHSVQEGTKLVAELHIRNCSWTRNKQNDPRSDDSEPMESTVASSTQKSPDFVDQSEKDMQNERLVVNDPAVLGDNADQDVQPHNTERPDTLAKAKTSANGAAQPNAVEDLL